MEEGGGGRGEGNLVCWTDSEVEVVPGSHRKQMKNSQQSSSQRGVSTDVEQEKGSRGSQA